MKKEYRDYTEGENLIYSYIVIGLMVFFVAFLSWNWDWFYLRLWLVLGLLLYIVVEIKDSDKLAKKKKTTQSKSIKHSGRKR